MIQMVSHLSFWFSWFSQCHFCRCPVQTPRNRPLHGYLELLSRYPEGCFHHPELPSKTSVMSVVEHPREVLGRRKKPFVFFFVIMVRNLNFIDIVCLVAGVVAFGSLFLRHVVFFQHIVLLPRPLWQQQAPSEKCRHTWSGNWGVFHLGKPPSRIRPNSHMVRPAVRLRWQRHKNRYGPRDRLVLTKWFPALSILSRTSCAIFWYSSRCCFASHSERGLRLPFKIHTVCITSNSNNCGWKRNCSFFSCIWNPSVLEIVFFQAFAVDTVHIRGQQCRSSPYFFFNDLSFVHDLTNNRWLPEFQAQHGVLCGFLRASRRPIRRKTTRSEGSLVYKSDRLSINLLGWSTSLLHVLPGRRQAHIEFILETWTSLNPRLKERENW